MVHLSLEQVHALCFDSLTACGCDRRNADALARSITQAEADECAAHGLFRLPWCVEGIVSGRVDPRAAPTAERLAPGIIRVDGNGGYAPPGLETGCTLLGEHARENGIAVLAFVNMFHVSALWPEVERLAETGLVALAMTPSYPYVAPAGGTKPLFGTNPIAFGWPRRNAPPLVFDQASSRMARGDIQIAARDGLPVPETAGLDPDGRPTTDPNLVLAGAQLAFGGYKGASLAMMVELLAGPLIGEFLSIEAEADDGGNGGPPRGGELILALDPARFGDADAILSHGEKLFTAMLEQPGTRLPGSRRLKARARTRNKGIDVLDSLYRSILALRE